MDFNNEKYSMGSIPTYWYCPHCKKWYVWENGYILQEEWAVNLCPEGHYGVAFRFHNNYFFQVAVIRYKGNEPSLVGTGLFSKRYANDLINKYNGHFIGRLEKPESNSENERECTFGLSYKIREYPCTDMHFDILHSKFNFVKKLLEAKDKEKDQNEGGEDVKEKAKEINKDKRTKREEEKKMDFFGKQYGANTDPDIASTIMGIAVRNDDDSWRIYDKDKKAIIDIGNIDINSLPICIVPSTKIAVGDLLKDDDENYVFVTGIKPDRVETLDAATGGFKEVMPINNIFGFKCYTKVVAMAGILGIDNKGFDLEKFFMMSSMTHGNGQMALLMLLANKEGKEMDSDLLLMMVAMSGMGMQNADEEDGCGRSGNNNSQMNMMLPIMLACKEGSDDMIKMMATMQFMGSNAANNPVISYIMLDKIMGRKKEIPEKTQAE